MSEPSRTITVHGIECEVPDCARFYGNYEGGWCYLVGPHYQGGVETSCPIDCEESCAFAASYWRAETKRIDNLRNIPGGFFEENKRHYAYDQGYKWQRAFEAAREGGK